MKQIEKRSTGNFTLFTGLLLMLSFCTAVHAGAGENMKRGHGPMGREFGPPPGEHLLSRAINDNMAAEVLVQMTDKSLEQVRKEIANTNMMEVLRDNSIDPDTFKKLMDAKVPAATEKALSCELITAEQAAQITARIESASSDTDTQTGTSGATE